MENRICQADRREENAQSGVALKEMKDDEKIRTSVYSVLPHEQRKRLPPHTQGTGYGTVTERRRNNRCLSRRPVLTFLLPNKQKFVNKKYVLYDIE